MSIWTYTIDLSQDGERNMSADRRILRRVERSRDPMTLIRFYGWDVPTVSIGRHQTAEQAADAVYCSRESIPIVRRPTGGRAVYHDSEVTYAIASNDREHFSIPDLRATYLEVAQALQRAMSILGIDCELATASPRENLQLKTHRKSPCFVVPSRYELLYSGRKLVGSAQRRAKRSFLQHGSIPSAIDYPTMAAALGVTPGILEETVISASAAAGSRVTTLRLTQALLGGFRDVFDVRIEAVGEADGSLEKRP